MTDLLQQFIEGRAVPSQITSPAPSLTESDLPISLPPIDPVALKLLTDMSFPEEPAKKVLGSESMLWIREITKAAGTMAASHER